MIIIKFVKPMGSTRPMWVGLDLCNGSGWVEFFFTHHGGLGQKIPLTRPMHTPSFYLGNNLVSWMSKKQNLVSLSTAEVEYIAAGSCCA